jgi:[ribosomal protein S18]-alanine N-acetyltransferase
VQIVSMTAAYAADIVTWRYPPPYDCYDMTSADPAYLTDPASGFFALVDGTRLTGFRSFGTDGQVPGGVYDESALDTGGGLRPGLTGKGLGREAIQAGLAFGRARFAPPAFRVTIATFNLRAQRVVEALGFRGLSSFRASTDGRSYEILVRPEAAYPPETTQGPTSYRVARARSGSCQAAS